MFLRPQGLLLLLAIFLAGPTAPVEAQEKQQPQPYRLSIEDAVRRGLQNHLRVRAADTRVGESAGTRERALANLLPRARGEAVALVQTRNLAAFGISAPGIPIPEVVGPFSNYDFRVYAEQPVFDLRAYHGWKATRELEGVARQEYQDARDQIVRLVTGLYLNAQAAAARVDAARSLVTTSQELHRLAQERRGAGVATGIDVLRAEVELANAQQRLLETQNTAVRAVILLARNIGISPGTPIELAEKLHFGSLDAPEPNQALARALSARADYQALLRQREALRRQLRASEARAWPRLAVGGNYGGIGRSVGDVRRTGAVQATLSVTLFDRDRQGEQTETEARIQRLDYQAEDLRLGIEQEIRDALLALESAAAEVAVAQRGLELARQELELARERFQAGVSSNIEVVTAQSSLARAEENVILAVTRHTDAKMALARAVGGTEQNYLRYLSSVAPPGSTNPSYEGERP